MFVIQDEYGFITKDATASPGEVFLLENLPREFQLPVGPGDDVVPGTHVCKEMNGVNDSCEVFPELNIVAQMILRQTGKDSCLFNNSLIIQLKKAISHI